MTEVPIISLADTADEVSEQLAKAYTDIGFCVIVDHDVPISVTEGIFDACRRFHSLGQESKDAVAIDHYHRGFIAMNTSTVVTSSVATVTKPNQSESFMVLHDPHPADEGLLLAGPNRWPSGDDQLRPLVESYRNAMTELGLRLVPLIAQALGETADALDSFFERPTTWTRLLRYPPSPSEAPADLYGSAPHTDYGFITLVASPDVGGLQIRDPDGGWIHPPSVPNGLVVNAGDMLHRWSNGRFRSTPHRVINDRASASSEGIRWSVPFFFDPHVSAVVAPLPSGGAPTFDPVRFEDYLRVRLQKNYRQHQA